MALLATVRKQKTVIIVFLKNKLITIDAVLPILMELNQRYADKIAIKLVFPNKVTLDEVHKNFHINQAISALNADVLFLRGQGRLAQIMKTAGLIATVLFNKTVVIKFSAAVLFRHAQIFNLIKKLSYCTEIFGVLGVAAKAFRPEASNVLRSHYQEGSSGESTALLGADSADYLLSSMTAGQLQEVYGAQVTDDKLLFTGYYRGYPAWLEYVAREKNAYPAINGKDYFLFVLTTLGRRLPNINEPPIEELLEESLNVLRKFNDRIHTVFKPHPVTNIQRFQEILDKIGYRNYSIDYGHPMILSANAKFVVANLFSTTLVDSYYLGCPIIEYCQYDPRVLNVLNNKSHGQELCDFFIRRDPYELEATVTNILDNVLQPARDLEFVAENFPPMANRFFEVWDKEILT